MKTLDKYINNLKIKAKTLKDENIKAYLGRKKWFKDNNLTFNEKEEKESIRWYFTDELVPTLNQWEQINKEFENYLDALESMINSSVQWSNLPEIEVLKNAFIDIWTEEKLYFRKEYLEGKLIILESKDLSMDRALNMFAWDLANVSHCNNIESKIRELEGVSPKEQIIKNVVELKKPITTYDDIFTTSQSKEIAFNTMISLGMIDNKYKFLEGIRMVTVYSFIEVCVEKELIFGLKDLPITPRTTIFTERLGLKNKRITKSNGLEKARIRKEFEKYTHS